MELVPGSGASQKKFPFSQYKPKNSNPIILIPARLIEDKGIFEAIEASKILMKNGIAHTMKFLGDIDPGNPTSLTKIQVEKLALENPQVTFLGFQSDVPEFLASADIVCLPSYREGLPTALVEAMAVGRAIVGFDSIGIRDIIQHERTGLLAIRKSSEDLAKQLTRLIENPELRLELSKNAHSYFKENLEIERIIDQMKKIYLETSAIE